MGLTTNKYNPLVINLRNIFILTGNIHVIQIKNDRSGLSHLNLAGGVHGRSARGEQWRHLSRSMGWIYYTTKNGQNPCFKVLKSNSKPLFASTKINRLVGYSPYSVDYRVANWSVRSDHPCLAATYARPFCFKHKYLFSRTNKYAFGKKNITSLTCTRKVELSQPGYPLKSNMASWKISHLVRCCSQSNTI